MLSLLNLANQFLTERNWWQFHNPKNDSLNIVTEVGELAELFVAVQGVDDLRTQIADEMADVLFGTLLFATLTQTDLSSALGLMTKQATALCDEIVSYDEIKALILANLDAFKLTHLKTPEQVILSLTWQATKLTDLFIWCTPEESIKIAQANLSIIQATIIMLIAYLVYLADLLKIDLDVEYVRKMAKNNDKYPVAKASGSDYEKIKDAACNNKK